MAGTLSVTGSVAIDTVARTNGTGKLSLQRGWRDMSDPLPGISGVKPTNPKDAVGITKLPFSVIPFTVIWEVGLGMLEGTLKYARHNYRVAGVRASVYVDATFRHMTSWWEGEDLDPDSGLSHVTKAIASLVVLRDSMIQGNWVDDRPPPSRVASLMLDYNAHVRTLLAKYPDPPPPHTRVSNNEKRGS